MSLHELQQRRHRPLHICITGSASGIGAVAAKRLVEQGHVVYHACRSLERAQEAAQRAGGGVPVVCDLSSLESVRRGATTIAQSAERLDALCLNAGVAPDSTASAPKLTADGLEECIGVNHLGHFLLAKLLYPKLKANPDGARLVVTASSVHDPESGGGKSGGQSATVGDLSGLGVNLRTHPKGPTMVDGAIQYNGGKVYKDSKLCNLLFVAEAAKRYASHVRVVSFNPGFVPTTGLFDSLRERSPWKATAMVWAANWMGWTVPLNVAGERLVHMILDPNIPTGSYYSAAVGSHGTTPDAGFQATAVSKEASNMELALKLWEKSDAVVDL